MTNIVQFSAGILLIYAFANLIYIYIINHLLNAVLGRIKNYTIFAIVNMVYYISILLVFLLADSEILNLLVNAFYMLLIAFTHEANISRKILSCIILLSSLMGVEVIVSVFANLFEKMSLIEGPNSGTILIFVVISKMAQLIMSNMLSPFLKKMNKKEAFIGVPGIYWVSITLIPLANMFVIYSFYLQCLKEDPVNLLACISIVIIVAMTLLVFIFYNQILDYSEAKAKLAIQDLQLKNYILAYQNFQSMANDAFEIKHNLKNTAISLLKDLETNDSAGFERVKTKLQDIVGAHKDICQRRWSGIPIIDAILNTKSGDVQNLGIAFDVDLHIYSFPLDENLICVILGNALDNAIEACSKVPKEKRWIKLIMSDEDSNLYISISNSYNQEITFRSDTRLPFSTKCNPQEHGFGLSSIQRLIQQDDGIFNIDVKNNQFQLSVVLYKKV